MGIMGGEEFDDFEKSTLELRHSESTRLHRMEL